MQDEQQQPDTEPMIAEPDAAHTSRTSPNRQITKSRDGAWLALIAFIVIAIALGWGVHWFFKQSRIAMQDMQPDLTENEADNAIDPDAVYTLKRDLLLGYTANGTPTLLPARDDLPRHAYGRRSIPTLEQARTMAPHQLAERDLAGVVVKGTPVRFVELIEDPTNQQTRILLRVEILEGPYKRPTPVLGMHLESTDTDEQTGARHVAPRDDLFAPVQSEP